MTPRETIARAIYEGFCAHVTPGTDPIDAFDDLTRPIRDSYLQQADVVIEALALMEPTEAMVSAGVEAPFHFSEAEETAKNIWRAMTGAMDHG